MDTIVGNVTITGHGDRFIFEGKYRDKIVLENVTKSFIEGFRGYIRFHESLQNIGVKSNLDKIVSDDKSRDIDQEVIYLGGLFNIEAICRTETRPWIPLTKAAYYNQQWIQYISSYGFTTDRYTAYAVRDRNAVLIQSNSIEFLKGFYLVSIYQNAPVQNRTRILWIHDKNQLCHQYLTCNIGPDYTNANKILTADSKIHDVELTNYYHEIKNSLKDIICTDVVIMILEYALIKQCQYHNGFQFEYDYVYRYTHCLTLSDFADHGPQGICNACKSMVVNNYGFRGHPFKIDIELVVAKEDDI